MLSEPLLSISCEACDPAKTGTKSMSVAPPSDKRVAQLIDANLDRAREGLRVIEDWSRFFLAREDIVITLKDWRHQLGIHHLEIYKNARSTTTDQGLGLSHPSQKERQLTQQVVSANFARIQEALRVIEEFTRPTHPELSKVATTIRYEVYELEVNILKVSKRAKRLKKLLSCRLYLITSPCNNLTNIVRKVLKTGVNMVQYRSKEGTDLEKLSEAKALSKLCKEFGALLIINDRTDLALAVDADGVHLGQDDMPSKIVRNLIGEDMLIGKSTHCLDQLYIAQAENCDYLGVGPVNSTKTKPSTQPVGINYVREALQNASLPWFAIGGINSSNLNELYTTGSQKIAVSGAIMNASDPSKASKELLERLI